MKSAPRTPLTQSPRIGEGLPAAISSGLLSGLLAALLLVGWTAAAAGVGIDLAAPAFAEGDDSKSGAKDAGRKNAIKGLKSKIRKLANSKWKDKKKDELLKHLEALSALAGPEAGAAALGALAHPDEAVRNAAFVIVEREHDKSLTKPMVALLEDKRYRRDTDALRRLIHALAVIADPRSIEAISKMMRYGQDANVVAEAADALAVFGKAKLPLKKIAVRSLVDVYETTWNLKESVKTDQKDKVMRREATQKYKVYGKALRFALEALTGATKPRRPHEWRDWWNANKKKKSWGKKS